MGEKDGATAGRKGGGSRKGKVVPKKEIPPPPQSSEGSSANGDATASVEGGALVDYGDVPINNYCSESPCLNKRIHDLHMNMLGGVEGAETEIERYIMPCMVLQSMCTREDDDGESGGDVQGVGSKKRVQYMWMKIRCLCRCPEHDIYVRKELGQLHFDVTQPKFLSKATALELVIEDFLPTMRHTFQYRNLPDLGTFLQAVLQKRFFTTALRKHQEKINRGGGVQKATQSVLKGRGSNVNSNGRPPQLESIIESICCTIIQESIPCLKRAKRTNKSITLFDVPTRHELVACVNVMYGTLLKLYPRGAKKPIFSARVKLARRLGIIINSPPEEILNFIQINFSLFKLCFMEHSLNFLKDFMPCERQLLMMHTAMEPYESICHAMCDNFRQDTILTGDETWEQMNSVATASIERCIRICKFKMLRIQEPVIRVPVQTSQFCVDALNMRFMMGDAMGLRQMHPGLSQNDYLFARNLQQHIRCYPLPENVYRMQLEALWDIHSACFNKLFMAHHVYFCLLCALNDRTSKTKLRKCSMTNTMSCTTCPPGTVVCVNMLGVVLKICNTSYYMCPCCTGICNWRADGMDLCPGIFFDRDASATRRALYNPENPCTCLCPPPLPVAHHQTSLQTAGVATRGMMDCVVCENKHVGRCFVVVPDLERKVMVKVHFCAKHVLPDYMRRNVHNTMDLRSSIAEHIKTMKKRGWIIH